MGRERIWKTRKPMRRAPEAMRGESKGTNRKEGTFLLKGEDTGCRGWAGGGPGEALAEARV